MDLELWRPWYRRIAESLNISEEKDQKATSTLNILIQQKALDLNVILKKIQGRDVLIFGAGPSLKENLEEIMEVELHKICVNMVADGATSALLEEGLVPDIVVTDLDGEAKDLLKAERSGARMVIHAHGDNMNMIKSLVPQFYRKVLGTTQVRPVGKVYNFGGFTVGDRCAFLAEEFKARKIFLAGMDLGSKVGKYSKPHFTTNQEASSLKRKKLEIAKQLLEWLSTWAKADIINLTAQGQDLKGVRRLTSSEAADLS
jgi:uncharacterized Rossmann fold enzyme